MRSLGLDAGHIGMVQSTQSLVKLLANVPAASLVERVGRRPLLVGGAALEAVAMAGMGLSTSAEQMVACTALAGVGGTALVTGSTNYLSDISTPPNRAHTTAPLQMTALAGVSLGRLYPGEDALANGLIVAVPETTTTEDVETLAAALEEVLA